MNDTNCGPGMVYDTPEDKEIERLSKTIRGLRAEVERIPSLIAAEREAVIAALTDTNAIIDAIDKYAENYADDDRQDIGVDVHNAFSAGVGYACDLVRARSTPTAEERKG